MTATLSSHSPSGRSTTRSPRRESLHLTSHVIVVDGRSVAYATGGRGLPVLFIHGWGLDHRAYRRPLKRLILQGCRVIAPSLPGFGGTSGLKAADLSLTGHANWVARFLEEIGEKEALVVLGHSFGGGVATRLAVENLLRDPVAVTRTAWLAQRADVREDLETLASKDLGVTVLWSDRDTVIPSSAFDTFCQSFGANGHVAAGGTHGC